MTSIKQYQTNHHFIGRNKFPLYPACLWHLLVELWLAFYQKIFHIPYFSSICPPPYPPTPCTRLPKRTQCTRCIPPTLITHTHSWWHTHTLTHRRSLFLSFFNPSAEALGLVKCYSIVIRLLNAPAFFIHIYIYYIQYKSFQKRGVSGGLRGHCQFSVWYIPFFLIMIIAGSEPTFNLYL